MKDTVKREYGLHRLGGWALCPESRATEKKKKTVKPDSISTSDWLVLMRAEIKTTSLLWPTGGAWNQQEKESSEIFSHSKLSTGHLETLLAHVHKEECSLSGTCPVLGLCQPPCVFSYGACICHSRLMTKTRPSGQAALVLILTVIKHWHRHYLHFRERGTRRERERENVTCLKPLGFPCMMCNSDEAGDPHHPLTNARNLRTDLLKMGGGRGAGPKNSDAC